jgi:hypothetical protein
VFFERVVVKLLLMMVYLFHFSGEIRYFFGISLVLKEGCSKIYFWDNPWVELTFKKGSCINRIVKTYTQEINMTSKNLAIMTAVCTGSFQGFYNLFLI